MPKTSEDWIRTKYAGRLPAGLHLTHFNSVRGINRYEHVAKVIVLSRTQPPLDEIERLTGAIFDHPIEPLPGNYFQKRARLLQMRNGSREPITTEVHPVDEAMALLEQTREAEAEQAAHRARPVNRPCEIDLVSIVGIDMTIDETLSYDDWIAEGGIVALALARGVLPETSEAFAKLVSDVGARRTIMSLIADGTEARRDLNAARAAANECKTPYIDLL